MTAVAVTVSPRTCAFSDTLVSAGSTTGSCGGAELAGRPLVVLDPARLPVVADPLVAIGPLDDRGTVVAELEAGAELEVGAELEAGAEPGAGDDAGATELGVDPEMPPLTGCRVIAVDGAGDDAVGAAELETGADSEGEGTAVVIEFADGEAQAESSTSRAAATAPTACLRALRKPVLRKMLLSGGRDRPQYGGGLLETLKHHESTTT